MSKYTLGKEATLEGEWWLPDQLEGTAPLHGTLTLSETSRASLTMKGTFNATRGAVYGDERYDYPAIFGATATELVTVLHATRTGQTFNLGAAGARESERVSSSWTVVGAHVSSDTLYTELRFRIPGLELWLDKSGITCSLSADAPFVSVYQVVHDAEEQFFVPAIGATMGWAIAHSHSTNFSKISVTTSAYLRIGTTEPRDLDWFVSQLSKATTLLCFMAGTPMGPDQVDAKLAGSAQRVEILVALSKGVRCAFADRSDFYMLRTAMKSDLGAVLAKWFELYDSLEAPSQLAQSVMSSTDLWLHVKFLSLMQALEGLHRATKPGLYMLPADYESIRQTISNAIPSTIDSGHKDSLKARVKYGNEISLRKRMNALAMWLDEPLRNAILGGDGSIPGRWIDTRNYYTHWDKASKSEVLDGQQMYYANVRLQHLLRALYLQHVGIPQFAVLACAQGRSTESQTLIQINNAQHRKNNPGDTSSALMHVTLGGAPVGLDEAIPASDDEPNGD